MERARLWLLEHLPAGVIHQPAEWCLAALCLSSGALSLAGLTTSDAVAGSLPPPAYRAWGLLLVVGSVALAAGLASIRRSGANYIITRVPAYRLGLRLLGSGCVVYSATALAVAGVGGIAASVAPLAFAAMCAIRLLTLGDR